MVKLLEVKEGYLVPLARLEGLNLLILLKQLVVLGRQEHPLLRHEP